MQRSVSDQFPSLVHSLHDTKKSPSGDCIDALLDLLFTIVLPKLSALLVHRCLEMRSCLCYRSLDDKDTFFGIDHQVNAFSTNAFSSGLGLASQVVQPRGGISRFQICFRNV
jgi:hypothetical protein